MKIKFRYGIVDIESAKLRFNEIDGKSQFDTELNEFISRLSSDYHIRNAGQCSIEKIYSTLVDLNPVLVYDGRLYMEEVQQAILYTTLKLTI